MNKKTLVKGAIVGAAAYLLYRWYKGRTHGAPPAQAGADQGVNQDAGASTNASSSGDDSEDAYGGAGAGGVYLGPDLSPSSSNGAAMAAFVATKATNAQLTAQKWGANPIVATVTGPYTAGSHGRGLPADID